MKILKLKNFQLVPMANWLGKLQLHGPESRYRTRFIKLLAERIDEIEKERIALCKKYQDKNKKGEPLFLDKNGKDTVNESEMVNYKIVKDLAGFNKEYLDYLNEDFFIEVNASNQDTINGIKGTVLNTTSEFAGQDAALYEAWCDSLENMKE